MQQKWVDRIEDTSVVSKRMWKRRNLLQEERTSTYSPNMKKLLMWKGTDDPYKDVNDDFEENLPEISQKFAEERGDFNARTGSKRKNKVVGEYGKEITMTTGHD